jgi:hypothetical protein
MYFFLFLTDLQIYSFFSHHGIRIRTRKTSESRSRADPDLQLYLLHNWCSVILCSLKKVDTKEPTSPVELAKLEINKSEVEEQILQYDRSTHFNFSYFAS